MKSSADQVFIVLGHSASQLNSLVPDKVHIIEHNEWEKGMGSSLKAGVVACIKSVNPDAIIISVCDQPLLTHQVFDLLIQTPKEQEIVASSYDDNSFGPPVLFRKSFYILIFILASGTSAVAILKLATSLPAILKFLALAFANSLFCLAFLS